MNQKLEAARAEAAPAETFGLLANGSCGRWDIAVDELLGVSEPEWSLEIESPQMYLVFRLQDLGVVAQALEYLRSGLAQRGAGLFKPKDDACGQTLGRFGTASVFLLWDNEDPPRCFILIGAQGRSSLRLSLEKEDIDMLVEALEQVVQGLSTAPSIQSGLNGPAAEAG